MKIWIDGYEANVSQRLGSSQVAFELLNNLEKMDHKNDYTILLPNSPVEGLPEERLGWRYRILKPSKFWTRIALPISLFLEKRKPDIFFSPTHYTPRFSPVKRIITIFDLAYLHFPKAFKTRDLWQMKLWTKQSIKSADHIITISQSTKKDLIKSYRIDKDRITVAYPGFDSKIFHPVKDKTATTKILNKYGIVGKFVLYVGTLQPRKNLIRLIEAFQKIEGLKLVIVGKTTGPGRSGWMYEDILNKPVQLKIRDKVIFTGFVPTVELPYLMSQASAFVLPSLWEGFGIPVVEAMACGAPAIVSNVSSLPEVVGEAGLLINPYSTEQIEQAIRTLSFDTRIRNQKSKQSIKQAQKFSWRKMARSILNVFEEEVKK